MRSPQAAAFLLCLASSPALGQDPLPAAKLDEIRGATVLVVAATNAANGGGSGTVIGVNKGSAWIATNRHHFSTLPRVEAKGAGSGPAIAVVFRSGTPAQETKTAEVYAEDADLDLAILRVDAPRAAIKPLEFLDRTGYGLKMPVTFVGYPGKPAFPIQPVGPSTATLAATSSDLIQDPSGLPKRLVFEAIDPGYGGGPAVDSRGRLVGIVVAGKGSVVVPFDQIAPALVPQLGPIASKRKDAAKPEDTGVEVEVPFIDPLGQLKGMNLLYGKADPRAAALRPDAMGNWPSIPSFKSVPLRIVESRAVGSFEVSPSNGLGTDIALQASYTDASSRVRSGPPTRYRLRADMFAPPVATTEPPAAEPTKAATTRPTAPGATASTRKPGPMTKSDEPKGGFGDEPKGGFGESTAAPKATGESIGSEPREVDDLKVTEIKVDAAKVPRCVVWSGDGKSCFVLEKEGLLRRISLDGMVEALRLEVGHSCSWLSQSAAGLVLTLDDIHEVWVVDPATFQVKKKIAVHTVNRAVSSPALSIGFASGKGRGDVAVIDLKAGKGVRVYDAQDFKGQHPGFAHMDVTPDGKYLVTQGGLEQLQRYRIKGTTLTLEGASERIASNGRAVEISPDGYYVALPSGGGNGGGAYTTNVYKITELTKPAIVIKAGAYPQALGFDMKSKLVLGQNNESFLILFKPSGAKIKEYDLGKKSRRRETTKQILVHPDGGKALVLTDLALYLVDYPSP